MIRFETVYEQGNARIVVDRETNVMYLQIISAYGSGITVLLNEDGTPKVFDGENAE